MMDATPTDARADGAHRGDMPEEGGSPMSLVKQLEAMPDVGMVPVSFAREAVQEERERRLDVAAERLETIEMWVRIGTRHYSGKTVPSAARARLLEAAR